MREFVESLRKTSLNFPEIIFYLDEDDHASQEMFRNLENKNIRSVIGKRKSCLAMAYNEASVISTGDIQMVASDDIRFLTSGWDDVVIQQYKNSRDKILLVYGDDLTVHGKTWGCHFFLYRKWIEKLGYVMPPFMSRYADAHLFVVYQSIGRCRFVPVVIEHVHFSVGKRPRDNTTDRLDTTFSRDAELFDATKSLRKRDIDLLSRNLPKLFL